MIKSKSKAKTPEIIELLWNEFIERMGLKFLTVIDYHMYPKMKMKSTEAVLKKPRLFREVFVQTFGIESWLIFLKYLKTLCSELQIDYNYVLSWFGEEREEFIF